VSKERARLRAQRAAVVEREKAQRARRVARRLRRRELLGRLRPRRRRRTGRLLVRRSRGQRIGIVVLPALAIAAVWWLVPDPALRLLLSVLLVLALPAAVVVALDRRS
jgi:Flp pilus assembly protein TadB